VAAVFKSLIDKKLPVTGENFRKEMLAMKSFDLPLTGKITLGDDHTVVKPVYLMEVKGGKWTRKAVVGP
jgi:branched-chain amino acid transport system substrate-binding protein